MKPTVGQSATVGVGGGSLGFVLVWLLPQVTDLTIDTPETAAALTGALSGVIAWGLRYIPKPKG